MTAFAINSGGVEYYDQKTGGSVNATLDTYTISNGSTLVVRTDTYACPNHSSAFGSLDNVAFSGIGGEVIIDPTYVRYVAYTGGSGNSPAFGAAISQGGVSGVFLGVWANWQSEPIVPGAAIPASGFIKIGGVTGGAFSAGALTGIAATCSGADLQGWIEVRSAETATINVPRVGKFTSVEAWFEIGVTNGLAGQIISCPATGSFAGVFPACQVETSPGSGVYEWFSGVGSQASVATTRTDASCKFLWSTLSGLRFGSNGANDVGYLPPAGCRVRIPAGILTNCIRTVSGSGSMVLPNSNLATRQEFVTTSAGYIDLRGVVCQWYLNLNQAFYVSLNNCAVNDRIFLTEIASKFYVVSCVVSPTQAQDQRAIDVISCLSGGEVDVCKFFKFGLSGASIWCAQCNYSVGINFTNCTFASLLLRSSASTAAFYALLSRDCSFYDCVTIGQGFRFVTCSGFVCKNSSYYDHTLTTNTTSTNAAWCFNMLLGCSDIVVDGVNFPILGLGPYNSIVDFQSANRVVVRKIGSYASPLSFSGITGDAVYSSGDSSGLLVQRVYVSNTRVAMFEAQNSDTDIEVVDCAGDYSDANATLSNNTLIKNYAFASVSAGQVAVYGTHWRVRFVSTTAGVIEILCNEASAKTLDQCAITSGTPKFNAGGSVLMTSVGQQIVWEMPFFALGHTALNSVDLSLVGTNTSNLSYEFQYDIGAGYNGTWLTANATNFTAVGAIDPAVGIKIKLRVTCVTANASNALTNIRITTVTTSAAQSENLYPLDTITLTFTGLIAGSDVVVRAAGTSTILASVDSNAGTTWAYVYETPVAIDVDVIKPGYVPKSLLRNYTPSAQNSSLPVSQLLDRNYI